MAVSRILRRPAPNSVIYDLTEYSHTTITLPAGSTWTSGLHWHETHTEYLRVVQGRVRVRLGDTTRVISAADGEVRVDKNVWHEWRRAPDEAGSEKDDVVVVERTDPSDREKALFFWNLNAVILDAQAAVGPAWVPAWLFGVWMNLWVSLNLFVIFDWLDNFPVFLDAPAIASRWGFKVAHGSSLWHVLTLVDRIWTHRVLEAASRVGWACGIHPVRAKNVPPEVYREWFYFLKRGYW